MATPYMTHVRNLLNMFNSIIEVDNSPLGIFQGQIAEFERNFTTLTTQPTTLYITTPKEDPQTSFIKYTFTLASHTPLTPPGLRLEVYCPCIDMGSSGVILPRGVEFSAYTSFDPPTCRVTLPVQAKDCKGMDEKECKNNPDICTYRRVKGGKMGCAAKRGTLKPGTSKTTLHRELRDIFKPDAPKITLHREMRDIFKPMVMEYLPDLIGVDWDYTAPVHRIGIRHTTLAHNHNDLTSYNYIEVVKWLTITKDTKFSERICSIVGGPVSLVGDMSEKFSDCTLFNSPVNEWNTSRVTDMYNMFYNARRFNQPIGEWNTSGVNNMNGIFHEATAFNQPLEQWDMSGVELMNTMFREATAFNQPLEKWNVSGAEVMNAMFDGATAFNQPLQGWNVSGVAHMAAMFEDATAFNQPLGQWNVSRVENMNNMFQRAHAFNQPLERWDTSKVTNMALMFKDTTTFNQPLERWNIEQVKYMFSMFQGTISFNQPLEQWDVRGGTYMNGMFQNSTTEHIPSWYNLALGV